jgi:TonB-dependent starch-binding outer membrane protein SusC
MNKLLRKDGNAPLFYQFFRKMKLTILIVTASILSCLSAETYSQTTKLTINENNTTLLDVLRAIEGQSEFKFFYNEKVDVSMSASVEADQKSVTEILDKVLTGTSVKYKVVGRQIALYDKNEMEPFISGQQEGKITGKVTDVSGTSLPGVSVVIKGTTTGSITDANGNYSLSDVPANAVLQYSFVGMKTQEIAAEGKTTINVALAENTVIMDEVVTVGYGTQKKGSLTSAITTVNMEKLENRSITNLSTALQGITPGVNIRQQTGRPGFQASTFDIRGASLGTFSNNPPLVIIDGIVDDMNNVNPEDVESISVLKDASAASIYGSRSTGGVVLITTKKGSSGKTNINYSSIVGVQKQPFANYNYLNTADWMRANNEAASNDGSPDIYSQSQIAKYENSTDPQYPVSSQWSDWIAKKAVQQVHNLSVSGGTEKINLFSSINYLKQDGFVPNDDYSKLNLLLNMNYNPTKKLNITTNVSFIKEDITRPATGIGAVNDVMRNSLETPPTVPFYLPNGDYNNNTLWNNNPAYVIKEGGNNLLDYYKLRLGLTAAYMLTKELKIKYITAAKFQFSSGNNIDKKIPFRDNNGKIYGYNRERVAVSEDWANDIYLNNQLLLEYKKEWNKHSLNVMGGATAENGRIDNLTGSANGFATNYIREISATTGTGADIKANSTATDWAIASLIGRINYSYDGKYLLESSCRYDGSSRFSPDQRWGFFPSFSAGWRISKENFMSEISFINDLKLRGSWGMLGNQGTTIYPFSQGIYTTDPRYPWDLGPFAFGNGLASIATLGDPVDLSLSWEKKRNINFGLDFGLLDNRLTGSFDYFLDRTSDIIGRPVVATTFGANAPIQNTFVIDNKGYELNIIWRSNVQNWRYSVGFNFADSRDKVVSLGGIGTTDPRFDNGNGLVQINGGTYLHEGESRNHFYLYRSNGLFVDQNEINNHAFISSLTRPGDISFTDISKDEKLTPADMVPDKRTTTPHYIFGFNLSVAYKNFDLSGIINGVGERWDYRNNGGVYLTGLRPTLAIWQENYNNRWTTSNPDKFADQPRLTNNNWISGPYSTLFSGPVDYHLRNFKYLRLKNLQFGYTLPEELTKKININKVRIFMTGENLLTFAPGYKESIDPESVLNYTSEGSAFFGQPRVVSFGLNVTF